MYNIEQTIFGAQEAAFENISNRERMTNVIW